MLDDERKAKTKSAVREAAIVSCIALSCFSWSIVLYETVFAWGSWGSPNIEVPDFLGIPAWLAAIFGIVFSVLKRYMERRWVEDGFPNFEPEKEINLVEKIKGMQETIKENGFTHYRNGKLKWTEACLFPISNRKRVVQDAASTLRIVSTLSLGLLDSDAVSRLANFDRSAYEDETKRREWEKNIETLEKQTEDIVAIWHCALHGALLENQSLMFNPTAIKELGQALGVDCMMEALAAGVSVEDIIGNDVSRRKYIG